MTGASALRGGWLSAGAIAAGFLLTAVLSVLTDILMHGAGIYPDWGEPVSGGVFVWATLYRVVFTVLGGYVTAALAPRRPMRHILALERSVPSSRLPARSRPGMRVRPSGRSGIPSSWC